MNEFTQLEIKAALEIVVSTIANCEKQQPRFKEGTSQHSLLKNRIKALQIAKALLTQEPLSPTFTMQELKDAVAPLASIISKSQTGIAKHEPGTATYTRFKKIIDGISIPLALLEEKIAENL